MSKSDLPPMPKTVSSGLASCVALPPASMRSCRFTVIDSPLLAEFKGESQNQIKIKDVAVVFDLVFDLRDFYAAVNRS